MFRFGWKPGIRLRNCWTVFHINTGRCELSTSSKFPHNLPDIRSTSRAPRSFLSFPMFVPTATLISAIALQFSSAYGSTLSRGLAWATDNNLAGKLADQPQISWYYRTLLCSLSPLAHYIGILIHCYLRLARSSRQADGQPRVRPYVLGRVPERRLEPA
jgi:hypothetical protein